MRIDDLVHEVRPAAGSPEGALVLLHGRATNEQDLLPLLDELDPDHRLVGVTPRGPLSLPPGGSHWYKVRSVGFPGPETFLPTYERLSSWFDALPGALDVPVERTVLGGYPVAIGHGRFDPIIEPRFGRDAHERLEDAGADVLWRESPVAHTLDEDFLPELRDFVERATSRAG